MKTESRTSTFDDYFGVLPREYNWGRHAAALVERLAPEECGLLKWLRATNSRLCECVCVGRVPQLTGLHTFSTHIARMTWITFWDNDGFLFAVAIWS